MPMPRIRWAWGVSAASAVSVVSAVAAGLVAFCLPSIRTGVADTPAAPKDDDAKWLFAEPTLPVTGTPYIVKVPLGLDKLPVPPYNLMTVEKVELGKQLYFDKRLSADNTIACATCHDPSQGWSFNDTFSPGIRGQKTGRVAPTVINSAYHKSQFWDGRAETLEDQALGPIQAPGEMGNTLPAVARKLDAIPGYKEQFRKVFGTEHVTADGIAKAIAAFERTVLSGNSAFDQWMKDPEENATAISESAKRGWTLFRGKARCINCHVGSNFSDSLFHNIGVGFAGWNEADAAAKRSIVERHGGRYAVQRVGLKNPADIGAYKTPGLRDIAKTAPYMHDGSEPTLEAVVDYYDRGGNRNPWISAQLLEKGKDKLGLTPEEKKDLVEFLKTLTGEPVKIEMPKLPE
jgi:cytochrome c peroxidase